MITLCALSQLAVLELFHECPLAMAHDGHAGLEVFWQDKRELKVAVGGPLICASC